MTTIRKTKAIPPTRKNPETDQRVALLESRLLLSDAITDAKLTNGSAAIVRQAFEGRVFEQADLDKFIKTVKENEAAADPDRACDRG